MWARRQRILHSMPPQDKAEHGEQRMRRARGHGQRRDWNEMAAEAMELARSLAPGAERSEAMKRARQLRAAAEIKGWLETDVQAPRPAPIRR